MAEISVSRALTFLDEKARGVVCVVAAIQFPFPEKVKERFSSSLQYNAVELSFPESQWKLDKASQLNVIIKLNPI